jgi:hypothetical protein
MTRRIAVVTDALSPDLIFPVWHRYYAGLFGAENVFLVTYRGLKASFEGFAFGGVLELPVGYDDETRSRVIGGLVTALLGGYDAVVRVDADEFLVLDPRRGGSLRDFIAGMNWPYMSARGFDVTQMPDEPALPFAGDAPILRDRAFAYPNTALNKTCITRTPVTWSIGFHWASVYPRFGPVFMLHMKRIDIAWQLAWYRQMTANIKDNGNVPDSLRAYYDPSEAAIREYHHGVAARERQLGIESWYRHRLMRNFVDKIALAPETGVYHGEYGHELVLCEIPPEWKTLL